MKSSYIKSTIFALAAAGMLSACSGDSNEPNLPVGKDFEGINLAIPSKFIGTRADGDIDPTEKEAKISNLTVLAYNTEATTPDPVVFSFTGSQLNSSASPIFDNYSTVPVRLAKGKYHIYLLANVAASDIVTVSGTTETAVAKFDNLKEAALQKSRLKGMSMIANSAVNVKENETQSKYLPMSCWYTTLHGQKAVTSTFTDGVVEVNTGASTAVYADLTLAVAEVRITLYNDKTPGLLLGNTNPVQLKKLAAKESTFENDNTEKDIDASVTGKVAGSYYKLPDGFNSSAEGFGWDTVDVTKLGDAFTPSNTQKWMWQSVVFIPERLYNTGSDKSTLDLAFNYGDSKSIALDGSATAKGFERSTFYELVGHIDSKEVTLYVRVKPWEYHKFTYDLE